MNARLLHVSDLHAGTHEEREVKRALARLVERLDPQLVVASGDLAHRGRPEQLERAIGVIYRPESERLSHYFDASLSSQFDAVIHFDETHALEPLERFALWETGEPPETFPTGV